MSEREQVAPGLGRVNETPLSPQQRGILEHVLLDIMYDLPSMKNVDKVVLDRATDIAFTADGLQIAFVSGGDVWVVHGLTESLERLRWRRFATGLYQPLGLRVVEDTVYVLGRDQITWLRDLNGDGEADAYENFNNDIMNTEHFHEFALDLQTDAAGDFYFMKAARHARDALHPHHGTLVKVSRDGGNLGVVAGGFRAPNGLGLAPDGTAYTTRRYFLCNPQSDLSTFARGDIAHVCADTEIVSNRV